ncbi:MAG: hypothetical protein GX445_03135 [Elusimicrobia bacterium]|nr:hypothetical protein [Elusimicrobiota bacterium]
MKHLCLFSFIIFNFISISYSTGIAFYYGNDLKKDKLDFFDYTVVQPENVDTDTIKQYSDKLFAYISIGEREEKLPEKLIIGENKDWKSYIADIREKEYIDILNDRIKKIKHSGFKNFFFDTIDSYNMILRDEKSRTDYERAIKEFIINFKKQNTDSLLMINRGFEIINDLKGYVDYIAAESLYKTFDIKTKEYRKMKEEDTLWLKDKLDEIKNEGFKVVVIDYIPLSNKDEALSTARKIKDNGFIPYISDFNLLKWGVNEYEHLNRKVLVFYDSSFISDKVFSQAHRLVSMPLEYMGYIPEIIDINDTKYPDTNDVAGIIVNIEGNDINGFDNFFKWIIGEINNGKKVLFLNNFPFPNNSYYFSKLGINLVNNQSKPGQKTELIEQKKEFYGEVIPSFFYSNTLLLPTNSTGINIFKNSKGQIHYQSAITPWGGYAIDDSWVIMFDNEEMFGTNTFNLFKSALRLDDIPILDPTTENGNRILIVHVDGDGFASRYENNTNIYASEILKKEILTKYKIPQAVSVIRGDIENPSISSDEQKRLKEIAKGIFLMDNVQIGNHSYSHPFKWINIKDEDSYKTLEQLYSLDIPGYKFDIDYEILGTKKWLETLLDNKKKNDIFFWTGDCIAPYYALKLLKDNNMLNINGGNTSIIKARPYQSYISPYGIERNGYYQIYTGQQNENIYTNLWTYPFWRYRNVIDTFKMTDKPRRLKPINIYYHFYSASKDSSLKALKDVYDYALSQDINPSLLSDYIYNVLDFYNYNIYRYNNQYIIVSDSKSKTLRYTKEYYPVISSSYSAAGYSDYNNERYTNLYGRSPYTVVFTTAASKTPYLSNSNGKIDSFILKEKGFFISLHGYSDIKYRIKNIDNCSLKENDSNDQFYFKKDIYGECR